MQNESFQEPLGYILSQTFLTYKKMATRALLSHDVTPEQYGVLRRLSIKDGVSQKKLAEVHVRDQTSIGKMLDKLIQKKLITRIEDPSDRRAVLIYLSDAGREMIEGMDADMQLVDAQAWAHLSQQEQEQFLNTISRIFDNLQK